MINRIYVQVNGWICYAGTLHLNTKTIYAKKKTTKIKLNINVNNFKKYNVDFVNTY